jgi:hypothetical protein
MNEGGFPIGFCLIVIAVMVMVFGLTGLILSRVLAGAF